MVKKKIAKKKQKKTKAKAGKPKAKTKRIKKVKKKTAKKKIKTAKKARAKEKPKIKIFKAMLSGERVISVAKESKDLYGKSRFGEIISGKVYYSLVEAAYLLEKKKLEIWEGKKKLSRDAFLDKARKLEPNFWTRYCVFSDMRNRGYIVKTALKFGADFRVYERGKKPGEVHAKWILFPVFETSTLTWHEFSAKNRVAHSTRKNLLIAIVDDENDVTYYSVEWTKP